MAADPAAQDIEMALNPGAGFQVNAGFYGGFTASLHGESGFHRGDDLVIGEFKARNIGPVQEIDMDRRTLGRVHGGNTFETGVMKFGFNQ